MTVRATEDGTVRDDPPVANDYGLVVRPLGPVTFVPESTTAVVTSVPASLVSVSLLAANANRIGFSIRNTSMNAVLYILANSTGGPASSTNHSVMLLPGAYYEDPYRYVDEVFGIWDAGIMMGELALVTEYDP